MRSDIISLTYDNCCSRISRKQKVSLFLYLALSVGKWVNSLQLQLGEFQGGSAFCKVVNWEHQAGVHKQPATAWFQCHQGNFYKCSLNSVATMHCRALVHCTVENVETFLVSVQTIFLFKLSCPSFVNHVLESTLIGLTFLGVLRYLSVFRQHGFFTKRLFPPSYISVYEVKAAELKHESLHLGIGCGESVPG